MAFHRSNLGSFGSSLPADMNGYVPEADDTADQFHVDLGADESQREWWYEGGGFEEWRDGAVEATAEATESLAEWQEANA